jgi:hypothetical protein
MIFFIQNTLHVTMATLEYYVNDVLSTTKSHYCAPDFEEKLSSCINKIGKSMYMLDACKMEFRMRSTFR